jgi:hypothetical protein
VLPFSPLPLHFACDNIGGSLGTAMPTNQDAR